MVNLFDISEDIRTEIRGLLGIKGEFDKELKIEVEKRKSEFERYTEEQRVELLEMVQLVSHFPVY